MIAVEPSKGFWSYQFVLDTLWALIIDIIQCISVYFS